MPFCRCGTANSAMFAEIVPEQLRSVVYAFDRSFEGAIAACAAPIVGMYFCFLTHLHSPLLCLLCLDPDDCHIMPCGMQAQQLVLQGMPT